MKKTIQVEGMSCTNCAKAIEKEFAKLSDITVKVNVSANKVIANYNEKKYKLTDIANIIKVAGYTPILDTTTDDKKTLKKMKVNIVFAIVLSLPLLWAMFGHIKYTDFIYVPPLFMNGIFQLITSGIVQFVFGRRFYIGAYKNIKSRVLGMDILVVLGTTSAFGYSLFLLYKHLFIQKMHHPEYYFEISAVIITMVLIGNYIEHMVKLKTTDALVDLINLGAKEARVIKDNTQILIPIDEVEVGNEIVVLANEKIPVDGVVIEGSTSIDESMMTGESIPVKKTTGSKVIGSTINQTQTITIKAEAVGSETILSQIIQTVEEASSEKPPIQRTADRIASFFVPTVVLIAISSLLIQYFLLGVEFNTSFERMIAILVISCPCALGLATPTSILVGNGLAAKHQILYKGGEFFELANKIQTICFDKTGTLTKGKPEVTDYIGDTDIIQLAYHIEKQSVHPISTAFTKYVEQEHLLEIEKLKEGQSSLIIENYNQIKGKGITATINNNVVYIGSIKILEDLNIETNEYIQKYEQLVSEAKTTNFIIVNNEIKAVYGVRDEVKPTSKLVIDNMHKRGLKAVMITGDNKVVAQAIASELGIDEVYAEVLPTQKADIVKQLQAKGQVVAFLGDGINDAPALKTADVGVAMGAGADIAIDSSDVTLMNSDLSLILSAIDLSKATLRNIYQNFFWAFSYNLIAIPLAAMGYLSMVVAGAAMAFSSIMVVLNALRLKRFKFTDFSGNNIQSNNDVTTATPSDCCSSESKNLRQKRQFTIPTILCGSCKAKITGALTGAGQSDFEIDVATKTLTINISDCEVEKMKKAIKAAGHKVL